MKPDQLQSLGQKLTIAICSVIALGLGFIVFFYAQQQEKNILLQNERAVHQIINSVNEGLQTVMITGSADVAELFAENLKGVKDVEDFRILRNNGLEAFKDNETIRQVNEHRGSDDFELRPTEEKHVVFSQEDPNLKKVLLTQQFTFYYSQKHGEKMLTFLLPIKNVKKCFRCHGKERGVLGVLEFTTSLKSANDAVQETRLQAAFVLGIALLVVLVVTMVVLRRYIIGPIKKVSEAMSRVSRGDLSQEVPILGRDELSTMAQSFNRMTAELRQSYDGFQSEHNKLETIIMGTHEGIIVTNNRGNIVLANPSAEVLLNKSRERIFSEGFTNLLDDPARMEHWLKVSEHVNTQDLVIYNQRFLAAYVSTIRKSDGRVIGHSVILRDMTEEKRMEKMLRDLSNTDALTSLANRRLLDETLHTEFALAFEQKRPLSILMFDIDHFKKFNDTYGHDQGDRVLKAFADTVQSCVRDILDTACRYGGEEFMVIARETPQEGGLILAERIREAVEAMRVDGLSVTTSIGVAGLQETRAATPQALIELADAALYEAKHAGRNQVIAAKTGGDAG